MLKQAIKKVIPNPILLIYHKILAILANIIYRFPSRKMIIIGVTGTKGKSSTVVMITRILEEAGFSVGSMNTIFFKIDDKEWDNNTKQGMLGRFKLQRMLRKMVSKKCTHAVIEVTSEGILQSRQWGIAFDVVVFTNLGEEHIESHGSFEKYREAKEIIFKNLHKTHRKTINKNKIKKVIVANGEDEESERFLQHRADEKWCVCSRQKCDIQECQPKAGKPLACLSADEIKKVEDGSVISIQGNYIHLSLHGLFMAQNALLAIAAVQSIGVSLSACESALEKISSIPGRAELIESERGFRVMIDYAHEPKSFEAILKTARDMAESSKVIAVFGVTGGGRDKAKRPKMGAIAAKYADFIVLTTDDPYDDDPKALIDDIAPSIKSKSKWKEGESFWRIVDRKSAIEHALKLAQKNDIVLLLGKGSEKVMAVKGGKMVPYSDRQVVENIL